MPRAAKTRLENGPRCGNDVPEQKAVDSALALLGLLLAIAISYTSNPTPAEPKIRTPVENCMDTWCAFDLANGRGCGGLSEMLDRYRWCKAYYP